MDVFEITPGEAGGRFARHAALSRGFFGTREHMPKGMAEISHTSEGLTAVGLLELQANEVLMRSFVVDVAPPGVSIIQLEST